MRRKVAVAVLTAALVGVVGAEGILKAREASLPKGIITVEEVEVVTVTASQVDGIDEQPSAIAVASM